MLLITDYLDSNYDRYIEWNQSLPINSEDVVGEYLPLSHPWGYLYSHRILCLIITLWPTRKTKMEIISKTYGNGCTKLMFVVDKASNPPSNIFGYETMIIELTRIQGIDKKKRNIWEKVHRMWTTVYQTPSLIENYDWFIKADDDTFIITENLHGFVQYLDPDFTHYLGHSIRSRWERENVVFNSGICYVLSRGTIKRIGPYQQHLPSMEPIPGRSHCIDREGAGEDPTTGICLLGVGIRPTNTLDHWMRERFLIFRDTDHQKIFREDTWYWKYKPRSVKQGLECCSPYLISVHNYKSDADALHFFPILQKEYNSAKDWTTIELPPRPRWFLYDPKQLDFEVDEWLNINDPPHGQRIFKGEGKEWQCWKCNIGETSDKYWTEWWDGVQQQPSVHINDPYSPIKRPNSN